MSGRTVDFDTAAERTDIAFNHIHADPASRYIGDRGGGRKTGFEDQLPDILIWHRIRHRHAALARLGQYLFTMQTGAVVGHFDNDIAALMKGAQRDGAAGRFAGRQPYLCGFDAVINTVTYQMRQRIGDFFDHALVEFGSFALGF